MSAGVGSPPEVETYVVPAAPPPGSVKIPSAHPPLVGVRRAVLLAAPVVLLLLWAVPAVVLSVRPPREAAPAVAQAEPDGGRLYAQHCAYCHGVRGDGNGTANLDPHARRFGAERFKLGTTLNGVPTDDDLVRVLHRGIPGSAMPKFDHLPEADRRAIVGHVRQLAWMGAYQKIWKKVYDEGEDPNPADVGRKADVQTVPGQPLAVPAAFAPATPESVARGRAVYLSDAAGCAKCHGPGGKGDGPQVKDLKNDDGTPNRPRDLTRGVFKGGAEKEQLYARIVLGIPGTPMPGNPSLPAKDVADLINYVLSLSGGEEKESLLGDGRISPQRGGR